MLLVILNGPLLYELSANITMKKIITNACAVIISRVGRLSPELSLPL